MPTYAPGPIAIEPLPLPPRVMQPDTFQSLGQSLVAAHVAFDDVVGQRLTQARALVDVNLDPDFDADVGPALRSLDFLDFGSDKYSPVVIVGAIDAVSGELGALAGDLPDPFEPDPVGDPLPPDATPTGTGQDLTAPPTGDGTGTGTGDGTGGGTSAPTDLVSPDEVHTIIVDAYTALTGHPPTDAILLALANDAGYVQGTWVSRAWLMAYLNSARARAVAGL